MNNMARKRRNWRAWERYVLYCTRRGQRRATAGMKRYGAQRMLFYNRRVARQNAEFYSLVESLTGLDLAALNGLTPTAEFSSAVESLTGVDVAALNGLTTMGALRSSMAPPHG